VGTVSFVAKQAEMRHLEEAAALFNEYRMFYGQAPDPGGARAYVQERLAHGDSVIFLAMKEENGVPAEAAGFLQLYPTFSSIAMQRSWILNDLFVRESWRRRGVAQLLLDKARLHALATGAKGLELSTAVTNLNAQRLYERNGYVRDEAFHHYSLTLRDREREPSS